MISFSNVGFRFASQKTWALKNISFHINGPDSWAIVGPDGAGKTTLLRLILGVLTPSYGQGSVLGEVLGSSLSESFFHQIAYVPQKTGLYPDLTVREHIELYARLKGKTFDECATWINELLELTLLSDFTQRQSSQLSGGMKQKLALICALVHHPKLLILDEPTVGVDIKARYEIWQILSTLKKKGLTIIWATADSEEAAQCDHVLFLKEGETHVLSTPKKVMQSFKYNVYHYFFESKKETSSIQDFFIKINQKYRFQSLRVDLDGVRAIEDPLYPFAYADQKGWKKVLPTFEDAFLTLYAHPWKELMTFCKKIEYEQEKKCILSVHDLQKSFGSFIAVQPLSFELHQGEILGLLGPNGCGKSTTFKMLCGLLEPSLGKALLWDQNIASQSVIALHKKIGYMPQKFALYRPLTVYQNIAFFAGLYGVAKSEIPKAVHMILNQLNLADYEKTVIQDLPLGLLQKVSFACALVHQPEILFLDEPTSGVDPITRQDFWKILLSVNAKGVSIIITTHFLEEAYYCHKILFMNQGHTIAFGSPYQLIQNAQKVTPIRSMGDLFLCYLNESTKFF